MNFLKKKKKKEDGTETFAVSGREWLKDRNKGSGDSHDWIEWQTHREAIFVMESVKWSVKCLLGINEIEWSERLKNFSFLT